MRILSLLLLFFGTAAAAEIQTELEADLNGNGVAELYELLADDENIVTLRISESGLVLEEVADFTWKGGLYGQEPELELAPNGSVRVIAQNEGCCRHRWRQSVTLAYRDAAFRVAGVTYVWRDSLDPEAYGSCDVNLLTGKGVNELGERAPEWFRLPVKAPTVSEWSVDGSLPDQCELG